MKRILQILAVLLLSAFIIKAQSVVENYTFSQDTGTFTSISSTGTLLSFNSVDDGYANLDLSSEGFSFPYCGVNYSTLSVNTNGAIRLGATGFSSLSNNLASTSYTEVIAPLWDDLRFYDYGNDQGGYYKLEGSGDQQILIIEWHNIARYGNQGYNVSFQIKLYEETGNIEFIYGDMSQASNWSSASVSIGINQDNNGTTEFQSVTPGDPPTVSTTTANNNISGTEIAGIAEGTIYRFTYVPPTAYNVVFHITDENSNPIENAQIHINSQTLTTDENGIDTIALYNGEYPFWIFAQGYEIYNGTLTVNDADQDVNVTLQSTTTYTVTFNVKDEGDSPIANANIFIDSIEYNLTTNTSGTASINLANGTYPYIVSKQGFDTYADTIIVNGSDVQEDIVLVEQTDECISFTENQNDIGINSPTFGVALADFNGDGWLDVVAIQAYDRIEVHFGNGDGTIDTTSHIYGADRARYGVAAFDIDNDGDMDFVTVPFYDESYGIEVWENDGNGNFTLKTDQLANYTEGQFLAYGDLDNDGDLDIFYPTERDGIFILMNDGNGNFSEFQNIDNNTDYNNVTLFDADNDGDLDAVVYIETSGSAPAMVFFNDGNGNFTASGQVLSEDDMEGIAAGDIDGDGDQDLVFAPWSGDAFIMLNDGTGNFLPGDTLVSSGFGFNDVYLVDLNYDNLPEIITDEKIWYNNHYNPGEFILQTNEFSGSSHDIDIGDINNDGYTDVYFGRFSSSDGDKVYLYNPPEEIDIDTMMCPNDSLYLGGQWIYEAGDYHFYVNCGTMEIYHVGVYDTVTTAVTVDGYTLTAVATGVSYQWINCTTGDTIQGATDQSFTPDTTGDYAVILTTDHCTFVSDCYHVEVPTIVESQNVKVYPNPTTGILFIKTIEPTTVEIYSVAGEKVMSKEIENSTQIDLSELKKGIYFLKLKGQNNTITEKLILQ